MLPRAGRVFDGFLTLAAAAGVTASVASLAAKAWWGFELLTHFRVQYLATLVPLFALLLYRRRPRLATAAAAAALLSALPLTPYLPLGRPAVAATEATEALRLLTVNVEWRNDEHERLLEIVAAESPDLVLVVEFTDAWRERLAPLYARYPHRVLLSERGAFGAALLSRHPLARSAPLELETTLAIDADVAAPQGTFRFVGVHLRPPTTAQWAAERNRQLAALGALAAATERPLVIAGDFNSTPYSPYFADWLLDANLRDARAGAGLGFSWPSFLPLLGIPIDHCIVSPEWRVADVRRLPAFGSDHYPVRVDLILGQSS